MDIRRWMVGMIVSGAIGLALGTPASAQYLGSFPVSAPNVAAQGAHDAFAPYYHSCETPVARHLPRQFAQVHDSGICGSYRPIADVGNGLNAMIQPGRDLANGLVYNTGRISGGLIPLGTDVGPNGYRAQAFGYAANKRCSECGPCGGNVYWPAPLSGCLPNRVSNPYSPLDCPPARSRLFTGSLTRQLTAPVSDVRLLPNVRCDNGYSGPAADSMGIVPSNPQESDSILNSPGYAPEPTPAEPSYDSYPPAGPEQLTPAPAPLPIPAPTTGDQSARRPNWRGSSFPAFAR